MGDSFDAAPRESIRPLSEGERTTVLSLLPSAQGWESLAVLLKDAGQERDIESIQALLMKEGERLYATLDEADRQQLTHTNAIEVSHLAAVIYTYTIPKISAFAAYGRANAFLHSSTRKSTSAPEDTWTGWD